MSIKQEIAAWDGKAADVIGAIYNNYYSNPAFPEIIAALLNDVSYQKGATWLLKKWLESGNRFGVKHTKKLYKSLHLLEGWESRLQVLQGITYMPIGKHEKCSVESFLRITLTNSNKFVRAWSYNGFYQLALQHPEYVDEAKQFFEIALREESASVKARIRNIMRKGF